MGAARRNGEQKVNKTSLTMGQKDYIMRSQVRHRSNNALQSRLNPSMERVFSLLPRLQEREELLNCTSCVLLPEGR
jgi:hypothetical protein